MSTGSRATLANLDCAFVANATAFVVPKNGRGPELPLVPPSSLCVLPPSPLCGSRSSSSISADSAVQKSVPSRRR